MDKPGEVRHSAVPDRYVQLFSKLHGDDSSDDDRASLPPAAQAYLDFVRRRWCEMFYQTCLELQQGTHAELNKHTTSHVAHPTQSDCDELEKWLGSIYSRMSVPNAFRADRLLCYTDMHNRGGTVDFDGVPLLGYCRHHDEVFPKAIHINNEYTDRAHKDDKTYIKFNDARRDGAHSVVVWYFSSLSVYGLLWLQKELEVVPALVRDWQHNRAEALQARDKKGKKSKQNYQEQPFETPIVIPETLRPYPNLLTRCLFPFGSCPHRETYPNPFKNCPTYHGGCNFVRLPSKQVVLVPDAFKKSECLKWHERLDASNNGVYIKSERNQYSRQFEFGVDGHSDCMLVHLSGYGLDEFVTSNPPDRAPHACARETSGRTSKESFDTQDLKSSNESRPKIRYGWNFEYTKCARFGVIHRDQLGTQAISYPVILSNTKHENMSLLPALYIGCKYIEVFHRNHLGKPLPLVCQREWAGLAAGPVAHFVQVSYSCYMIEYEEFLLHFRASCEDALKNAQTDPSYNIKEHIDNVGYTDRFDEEMHTKTTTGPMHSCILGFRHTCSATLLLLNKGTLCTDFGIAEPPAISLHKLVLLIELLMDMEAYCVKLGVSLSRWPMTQAADMVRVYELGLKTACLYLDHKDLQCLVNSYDAADWPCVYTKAFASSKGAFWKAIPSVHLDKPGHYERLMQLWSVAANHHQMLERLTNRKAAMKPAVQRIPSYFAEVRAPLTYGTRQHLASAKFQSLPRDASTLEQSLPLFLQPKCWHNGTAEESLLATINKASLLNNKQWLNEFKRNAASDLPGPLRNIISWALVLGARKFSNTSDEQDKDTCALIVNAKEYFARL